MGYNNIFCSAFGHIILATLPHHDYFDFLSPYDYDLKIFIIININGVLRIGRWKLLVIWQYLFFQVQGMQVPYHVMGLSRKCEHWSFSRQSFYSYFTILLL